MNIGVWGLGSIGLRHAKNAMALGQSVFGYDPDSARCNLLAEAGGGIYENEEDLLKNCDAVVICSPNHLHYDHLSKAIDFNCHVLIEKPLTHSLDGLFEVFIRAQEKELIIAPAMNMRFDDVVRRGRELLQQPQYSKVLWARFVCSSYLPSWRPHQDYTKGYTNNPKTGGVIFDIIHEFDIAHFILGDLSVHSTHAHNSGSIGLSVEDCADICLLSEQHNAPVTIHLDYISKIGKRYFEIQFEGHYLKADIDGRVIEVTDHEGNVVLKEDIKQDDTACYVEEMESFIQSVQGEKAYPCISEDALKVLQNVIKARQLGGLES